MKPWPCVGEASTNVQTVRTRPTVTRRCLDQPASGATASIAGRAGVEETNQTDSTVQGLAEAGRQDSALCQLITILPVRPTSWPERDHLGGQAGEAGNGFAVVASS